MLAEELTSLCIFLTGLWIEKKTPKDNLGNSKQIKNGGLSTQTPANGPSAPLQCDVMLPKVGRRSWTPCIIAANHKKKKKKN